MNRIRENLVTANSNTISNVEMKNEAQDKLEYRRKEVRNPVVDVQKQMSSQETVGVLPQE